MPRQAQKLARPQQLLDYLIELTEELRALSDGDFPSVSRHLQAAKDEAERLRSLGD